MVCSGAGTGCTNPDQGSFTPINLGATNNWAFSISPGPASGDLTLAFLVPTNAIDTATYNLPALTEGLSTSVSTTLFSNSKFYVSGSPDLAVFLGLANGASYSPTDNFSNLSAGETTFNPGFTGSFEAFTAFLPGITLTDLSTTTISNYLHFASLLPQGTVIAGLFNETTDHKGNPVNEFVGTAASAHLLTTPGPVVGAGIPGIVAACFGLVGLARRRRNQLLAMFGASAH